MIGYIKKILDVEKTPKEIDKLVTLEDINSLQELSKESIKEYIEWNETILIYLISNESYDLAKFFIENGANLDIQNKYGHTALVWACEKKNIDLVKLLIKKGANLNIPDYEHEHTPLIFITSKENCKEYNEVVKLLIENGAYLDIQNKYGDTAILWACTNKNTELVKLLIKKGANLDVVNYEYKNTPLIRIANEEDYTEYNEIAKLLIENGANLDIQNDDGLSALFFACINKNIDLVKLLIEKGANLNLTEAIHSNTPLIFITSKENCIEYDEIAKLLIENGANLNIQNDWDNTVLTKACISKNIDLVKLLIEKGANLHIIIQKEDTSYENTPLIAIAAQEKDYTEYNEIAKLLIENGVNLDIQDQFDFTALYLACLNKNTELVKLLIENGANLDVVTKSGHSPLISISQKDDYTEYNEIAKLLIKNGANLDIQNEDGYTALYWACEKKNAELVKLLIENGANLNPTTELFKQTPLSRILVMGQLEHIEIAKLLIENGANINIQDYDGYTALYWACSGKHTELVKLLIENGSNLDIQNKNGATALICIALKEDYKEYNEIAKLLIEKGANLDIQNKNGATALTLALNEQNEELIKLLLSNGADISINKDEVNKAFHNLLDNKKIEIVNLLIEYDNLDIDCLNSYFKYKVEEKEFDSIFNILLDKGVKVDIQDDDGYSAIHWACENRNIELVKLLIKKGANLDVVSKSGSTPLLRIALKEDYTKYNEIAKLLIENGANFDIQNKYGDTALPWACEKKNIELVKLLIKKGANLDVVNIHENTSLIRIAHKENYTEYNEIAKLLIENGANLDIQNKYGDTAILWACTNKNIDLVKLLIKKGANLDVVNQYENTPLIRVAQKEDYTEYNEIAKLLIENGANLDIQNNKGKTALYYICKNKNIDLLKFMFENSEYTYKKCILEESNKYVGLFNSILKLLPYSNLSNFTKPFKKLYFLDDTDTYFENCSIDFDELSITLSYQEFKNDRKIFSDKLKESNIFKHLGQNNIDLNINYEKELYEIKVYGNSNESRLAFNLKIKGIKPEFLKFDDVDHTSYILFKNISGVNLEEWNQEKLVIEDILDIPIEIEEYNHTHPLWKILGEEKGILIKESPISVMPDALCLGGKYSPTKVLGEHHFIDIEDVSKWKENIENIINYLGYPIEIDSPDSNIVIIKEPSIPNVNDNVPTVLTKDVVKDKQLFLGIKDRMGINKIYTEINKQTQNKVSGSILVSGESGSGKTTTINNLIRQYLYDYESLDQIVIFNFKSDAGFEWLSKYDKVKIIDGTKSVKTILKEFMLVQLNMNTKYAYNKFHGTGKGKDNFQEKFNSLIIVDEAQTIPNKEQTTKGEEKKAYIKISNILEDIASKIRATGDSLIISTQFPKNENIPGGSNVRDNLRHKFCGKGKLKDISQAIESKVLEENNIETHNLTIGQMLYYDSLEGRFENVFVQQNVLLDEDEDKLQNYKETEYNLNLSEKLKSLESIAKRADKLQQEILEKENVMFDNLEELDDFEDVDVFELAKEQLENEKNKKDTEPTTSNKKEETQNKYQIETNTNVDKNLERKKVSFDFDMFDDEPKEYKSFNEIDKLRDKAKDILKSFENTNKDS